MSIVLVTFPGAPTPCPEAIQKEKNLEEVIERRVKSNVIFCFLFFFLRFTYGSSQQMWPTAVVH